MSSQHVVGEETYSEARHADDGSPQAYDKRDVVSVSPRFWQGVYHVDQKPDN